MTINNGDNSIAIKNQLKPLRPHDAAITPTTAENSNHPTNISISRLFIFTRP